MAELATTQRYALVTGANKGIGFEICRQLAAKGTTVILASRDEKRGAEARERLVKELGSEFETYVVFHQLDVVDSASVAAVSKFIKTEFGRLDILVNNAGIGGIYIEGDSSVFQEYVEADFKSIEAGGGQKEAFHPKGNGMIIETFEGAKECIETNYYGTKRVTQALIPLLQHSHSPTIVNVSSSISSLLLQTNEWAKGVFSSEDSSLDEEKVEQVLQEFLKDFKEGAAQRYALVTGANKGIGFEVCRQLACKGITVILASRNERRGVEARARLLEESGVSGNVVFHQLDVTDPASIAAVSEFVRSRFGRLDILVNNAGVSGVEVEGDVSILEEFIAQDVKLLEADGQMQREPFTPKARGRIIETYEGAKECIETNYYGVKRVTQALIPLLQKSNSPRIVNVSSPLGSLLLQPNEWAKRVFSNEESSLTEEKVDEVVAKFLKDFKEAKLKENHWPPHCAAYKVSKEAMNAYTWVVAKKQPSLCINSVSPGFARTDITFNAGPLSEAEAAESPVKMALMPDGGPSGRYFTRDEALSL